MGVIKSMIEETSKIRLTIEEQLMLIHYAEEGIDPFVRGNITPFYLIDETEDYGFFLGFKCLHRTSNEDDAKKWADRAKRFYRHARQKIVAVEVEKYKAMGILIHNGRH